MRIPKINSNSYGGKWIALSFLVGVVTPLILWFVFGKVYWIFVILGGLGLAAFGIVCLLFLALTARLAYHQIIKGDEYALKAVRQQTADQIVSARRGSILDRNGSVLAASATSW